MGKSGIKITGLDKLKKDLKKMSRNVEHNKEKADGQLSIDTDLIEKEIDIVNSKFGSVFSQDSTKDDFINFFANSYQEIMIQGFLESSYKYNPKEAFNTKFNPYAKID